MIKSNIISVSKLTDGKNVIDLGTESEMNVKQNVIYCDKISNGRETFSLNELTKENDNEIPTVSIVELEVENITNTSGENKIYIPLTKLTENYTYKQSGNYYVYASFGNMKEDPAHVVLVLTITSGTMEFDTSNISYKNYDGMYCGRSLLPLKEEFTGTPFITCVNLLSFSDEILFKIGCNYSMEGTGSDKFFPYYIPASFPVNSIKFTEGIR